MLTDWSLVERTSGRIVVKKLELAASFASRLLGLQFRSGLAAGHGLLLVPCFDPHVLLAISDRHCFPGRRRPCPRNAPASTTLAAPICAAGYSCRSGNVDRRRASSGWRVPVSAVPAFRKHSAKVLAVLGFCIWLASDEYAWSAIASLPAKSLNPAEVTQPARSILPMSTSV